MISFVMIPGLLRRRERRTARALPHFLLQVGRLVTFPHLAPPTCIPSSSAGSFSSSYHVCVYVECSQAHFNVPKNPSVEVGKRFGYHLFHFATIFRLSGGSLGIHLCYIFTSLKTESFSYDSSSSLFILKVSELMAEALFVVGIVASIVQLVDFSSRVLDRLDEFQSSLKEVPRSFRHIKAELPVLRDTLQQTKDAIDTGSIRDETKTALTPAIEGCMEQVRSIDALLTKTLPTSNDSRLKRGTKAFWSLHQDAKVESIMKILRGYIATLTFYYAAVSSNLQPLTGDKL
jgi:hypothetical protein